MLPRLNDRMKTIIFITVVFLSLAVVASVTRHASTDSDASTFDVFSGTSPCADFVKPFLRIPSGEKCDRIKWQLNLYHNPNTRKPTAYKLAREYGFHVDNRTYQSKGSTSFEGKWQIARGRAFDPDAVIFQLDADKPQSLAFVLVDQNVLHPLDMTKNLLVGNSGYSYTLNRNPTGPINVPVMHTPSVNHSSETNLTAATTFGGRSPCREIARELNRAVEADCARLKWALTLNRDPNTLAPTTYKLRGTLYWNQGLDHHREGKWKVVKGTKTDPNAIVYELDAYESDASMFLLKADDGILFFLARDRSFLVGNEDFSYTLNRDTKAP
jgi:hypothetical protein